MDVRPRVALLVDSREYILSNCYQHQLFQTLYASCDVDMIECGPNAPKFPSLCTPGSVPDRILSVLKLRTLDSRIDAIRTRLAGAGALDMPIYVYEQDPWESFRDESPYKGAYHRIAGKLNIVSFLNTSRWWSEHVRASGLPSQFVTMWMLPEYCTTVPRWRDRKIDVGFCGQLHPYRRTFFEGLEREGIRVTIVPPTPYAGYLSSLSQMKLFVHSEEVRWNVDGVQLPANAMWIKDVEAAARGCLSLRDYEPEMDNYTHHGRIATIQGFRNISDAASRIRASLEADPDVIEAKVADSVEYIRQARGWRTVLDAMEIE